MNNRYIKNIRTCAFLLLILSVTEASAQLNPLGSMYFQNQYLGNPAMAGTETGLDLNLGFRQQWSNIPGSPAIQTLTADYGLNDKVGLGLNIYNDKAGLFSRTRSVASFAYHLPLGGEEQHLSFGVSLGFMNERIMNEDIDGDPNDIVASNYNDRDTYVDGDFGIAYSGSRFTFQAALPNMKSFFKKDINNSSVDRATFYSAASYKLTLSEGAGGFGLEPKVAYRGVKGMDNMIDAGANLTYGDRLNLFGMYHSSKSATMGIGMKYLSFGINGMYTTATSALSNYANGNFEVSLSLRLF